MLWHSCQQLAHWNLIDNMTDKQPGQLSAPCNACLNCQLTIIVYSLHHVMVRKWALLLCVESGFVIKVVTLQIKNSLVRMMLWVSCYSSYVTAKTEVWYRLESLIPKLNLIGWFQCQFGMNITYQFLQCSYYSYLLLCSWTLKVISTRDLARTGIQHDEPPCMALYLYHRCAYTIHMLMCMQVISHQ